MCHGVGPAFLMCTASAAAGLATTIRRDAAPASRTWARRTASSRFIGLTPKRTAGHNSVDPGTHRMISALLGTKCPACGRRTKVVRFLTAIAGEEARAPSCPVCAPNGDTTSLGMAAIGVRFDIQKLLEVSDRRTYDYTAWEIHLAARRRGLSDGCAAVRRRFHTDAGQ